MTWEYWIIAISIGLVALAFVALVIFLVITLVSVLRTLRNVDEKIHAFDPYFRVADKVGNAIERRTSRVKQLSNEVEDTLEDERRSRRENTALEVAEWALIGWSLWEKIKHRRR